MRGIAAFAIVLFGCSSSPTEPPEQLRQLGRIAGFNQDDPRIEITTSPGHARVRVTTYGGGCHSEGETQVAVYGRNAVIVPWDYADARAFACTDVLRSFVHETTIVFGSSGPARITIYGLDSRGLAAGNPYGTTLAVERNIVIP